MHHIGNLRQSVLHVTEIEMAFLWSEQLCEQDASIISCLPVTICFEGFDR